MKDMTGDHSKFVHPSKDIKGSKGNSLSGKTICVCLTGSVAVVNAPGLCRELMRLGAEVFVVMSQSATKLVHPDLLHWATGNEVLLELTGAVEHIAIAGERPNQKGMADLILVSPATANTISKIACGIDDTPVTTVVTTAFGSGTPIVIVPAMHESMYKHPILIENMKKLQSFGVDIIDPRIAEGKAKIAETEEILTFISDKLNEKRDLVGKNFLITAGPCREFIDRVRFISTPSTGKMGIEIAKEILSRGGSVTMLKGKSTTPAPPGTKVIHVTSVFDFIKEVENSLSNDKFDAFISAAAISDFAPIVKAEEKLDSSTGLTIELKPAPKIIDKVRKINQDILLVAFKAETNLNTEELVEKAFKILKKAKANIIVANDVFTENRGFECDTNEIYIIDENKNVEHVPLSTKRQCASKIIDIIKKHPKF